MLIKQVRKHLIMLLYYNIYIDNFVFVNPYSESEIDNNFNLKSDINEDLFNGRC